MRIVRELDCNRFNSGGWRNGNASVLHAEVRGSTPRLSMVDADRVVIGVLGSGQPAMFGTLRSRVRVSPLRLGPVVYGDRSRRVQATACGAVYAGSSPAGHPTLPEIRSGMLIRKGARSWKATTLIVCWLPSGRAACWSGQGPVKPPPYGMKVRVLPRPSENYGVGIPVGSTWC